MRAGKEGGGKGALVKDEQSLTLATSNDQVLFQPKLMASSSYGGYKDSTVAGNLRASGGDIGGGVGQPCYRTIGSLCARDYKGISNQYVDEGKIIVEKIPTYSLSHDFRSSSLIKEKSDPLTATDYKDPLKVNQGMAVRRLTPTECERLQGWQDGYTDILYNGKPASDTARYKALGNGMAQPVPRWIMKRLVEEVANEDNM